jgi:hypothetical protein
MVLSKKFLQWITAFFVGSFTFMAFAADQAAKEETIPPAAEGPLNANQIPPINHMAKTPDASPQKAETKS